MRSKDGKLESLSVVLRGNPLGQGTADEIPKIRSALSGAVGGGTALVGGYTAENYDTDRTSNRDTRVIAPLILLVIFIILVLLLQAVVAPLYLVATVVLSFAFTFGVSVLVIEHLFNISGIDAGIPLYAFIFLVALGVDYNIFLMSRVREESGKLGIEDGILEALETTGGVIASAGLILAGTFLVLTVLPINSLVQMGFIVALGVLVDTFIVRTILVPAIAFKVGKWNWWPSKT